MARNTLGLGMPMLSANSFTPVARITFASAVLSGTPSSTAAVRNCRANSGSSRSSANPSFQSLLLLAMLQFLHKGCPERLRLLDVLDLRALVSSEEKQDEVSPASSEVDPVAGSEIQSGLPDTLAELLVVSEVSRFESQDASLNASSRDEVERDQPLSERAPAGIVQELANHEAHPAAMLSRTITKTNPENGNPLH